MQTLLTTLNPFSAKFTKWLNTLKQFVGNLPTNYLSVSGHFVGLALKGLSSVSKKCKYTQWRLTVIYAIKSKNQGKIILKARKTVPI